MFLCFIKVHNFPILLFSVPDGEHIKMYPGSFQKLYRLLRLLQYPALNNRQEIYISAPTYHTMDLPATLSHFYR